jgi:hypothetical protein
MNSSEEVETEAKSPSQRNPGAEKLFEDVPLVETEEKPTEPQRL